MATLDISKKSHLTCKWLNDRFNFWCKCLKFKKFDLFGLNLKDIGYFQYYGERYFPVGVF